MHIPGDEDPSLWVHHLSKCQLTDQHPLPYNWLTPFASLAIDPYTDTNLFKPMFLNCRRTFVFVRHLHSLRAVNLAQPDQHFFIFIYLKNNNAQKQLPPLVFGTHFSFHFYKFPTPTGCPTVRLTLWNACALAAHDRHRRLKRGKLGADQALLTS